jgi:GTPase SAR1 family protein
VIVLCFSVVRPDSMENVKTKWIPELFKFLPNTPIILVGTQSDLRGQQQQQQQQSTYNELNGSLMNRTNTINSHGSNNSKNFITSKEGEELAKRIKAFRYIECSALTQQNISEVFEACITAYKQGEMPARVNCFRKLFTSCLGSRLNTCSKPNKSNKSVMAKYKKN